jgi:hypothetical protein
MIIKGGSRQNRRFFARHLLNPKDNDNVRVCEFKGFAQEDVKQAFLDMEAIAKGTRCENYFYHANLSPRADEHLTDEQWSFAVDTLEKHLGLEGQPRLVIEHEKEGRTHRHVIWSRIDADTMTARPDSLTYKKHEAAAREIEKACDLEPVASVLVKDRKEPRPERRARDYEGFRGVRSGLSPDEVKREVTALWQECDSGLAFQAALAEKGYILCRGDRRDFCIVDPAGDEHSLARRISGAKAADVRERLRDVDRELLPTMAEARAMANAWASDSDNAAARAVRIGDMKQATRDQVYAMREGSVIPTGDGERREFEAPWSELEKATNEYGQAVKDVARVGQDAYWQAFIGGKPRTEADKLHDLMWGKNEKEPERHR